VTPTRRAAVVVGLAVAFLTGLVIPAEASFTDAASGTASVTAATVAAPGSVNTAGTSCANGNIYVRLSWATSSARSVSGYAVTVYRADGSSGVIATTSPGTTSFANTYLRGFQSYSFTVTTRTSYGWSTESPRTPGYYC
jgi:hypothetical protein